MTRIPVLFIYDALYDEIYCVSNASESEALEITMSVLEEHTEKEYNCYKFNKRIYNESLADMIIYYNFVPVL